MIDFNVFSTLQIKLDVEMSQQRRVNMGEINFI